MAFGFGRGRNSGKIIGQDASGRTRRTGRWGHGGPPTNCVCPQCGIIIPREPGIPCFKRKCPKCGSCMTRQFLEIE